MVVKHGQHWAVIHAHAKKKGSKTDKPKGSVIKEFSTKKQALAMHRAIILSKKRRGKL